MELKVGRIEFVVDQARLGGAFEAFRKSENQGALQGRLTSEQVENIIRLTQLCLDEVICNRDWSLQVWGWLCRMVHHIGDEHHLRFVFSDHELLRFQIVSPEVYRVLFNGVEVGGARAVSYR